MNVYLISAPTYVAVSAKGHACEIVLCTTELFVLTYSISCMLHRFQTTRHTVYITYGRCPW